MGKAIIGKKIGMTRLFDEDVSTPVTVIEVTGCKVSLVDGGKVELGIGKVKGNKPLQGRYKKLGFVPRFRRVFSDLEGEYKVGDEIKSDLFKKGDKVEVIGTSKGKGFQGVMKRWGFKGGQRTHGQSDRLRAPGSIGAGTDPGRVLKGKKMGGRMGGDKVTLSNVKVIEVDENLVMIKGSVPGNNGDYVVLKVES
ncbi:50S ribosomal protein L3 [Candidatus Dojkabacteria bacterium]|nr:50S ribosomal protein L3 [Candidatus Dojkabacteria bacterium]